MLGHSSTWDLNEFCAKYKLCAPPSPIVPRKKTPGAGFEVGNCKVPIEVVVIISQISVYGSNI
jgi:hypothetical protein